MNLTDLYMTEGRKALNDLAEKTGNNPHYLYHCATGRKQPGPKLVRKIISVDSRFTKHELRPDFWGDDPPASC